VRFGIIGTNWITDKLIDAGKETEDFELAAVYSRKEETARAFADKYGVDTIFTDLEKMAEMYGVDKDVILEDVKKSGNYARFVENTKYQIR